MAGRDENLELGEEVIGRLIRLVVWSPSRRGLMRLDVECERVDDKKGLSLFKQQHLTSLSCVAARSSQRNGPRVTPRGALNSHSILIPPVTLAPRTRRFCRPETFTRSVH